MWLESIGLGLVLVFMVIGFVGAFIPMLPGPMLVWLSALVYAAATGFSAISPGLIVLLTVIAVVAATADIWMSLLGARTGGASARSLLWGFTGGTIGFLLFSLFGALIGYALGIVYAEYSRYRDLSLALKASVGGLVGWGLSTLVQAAGALVMIIIFIWKVWTYHP